MTIDTVEDLNFDHEIAAVVENAQLHGWPFERVGARCFRVSLISRNGDTYELEVDCNDFPVLPPAFHWRNPVTGELDLLADSPAPNKRGGNFFYPSSGRICAPWNRLASTEGGPHLEWVQASWKEQPETKGTVNLAAMVLRVHHELRRESYGGRRN